jgi:hypothetical protein
METRQTCGQGLAENSVLPAKLGELTDSMAAILEIHMGALDLRDNDSRREHEAYRELARENRKTAAALQETARRMAGYRDLPMGAHDMSVMSSPRAVAAFQNFVKLEDELVALLRLTVMGEKR